VTLATVAALLTVMLIAASRGHVDLAVVAAVTACLATFTLSRGLSASRELHQLQARLTDERSWLGAAHRLTKVGSWSRDLLTDDTVWSPELHRILGLDPAVVPSVQALLDRVHPEDVSAVCEVGTGHPAAPEPTADGPPARDSPVRIVRPDGTVRMTRCTTMIVPDRHGRPARLVGALQDITDRYQTEEEAARLASIVEFSTDAILQVDLDGYILSWNAAAGRLFGYPAAEMIGRRRTDLLPDGSPDHWSDWLPQLAEGAAIDEYETVWLCRDGRSVSVTMAVSPIVDRNGVLTGASVIARDISHRRELENQLTRQALHDPLTGLANRALLRNHLDRALARRTDKGLALLVIDIDDFKMVNDSLGHETGDRLLVAAAGRLRACARAADTVARLGGDEFAILLEDVHASEVTEFADRVVAALRPGVNLAGTVVSARASIGIALHAGAGGEASALLREADLAMYAAKRADKGSYRVFAEAIQTAFTEQVKLTAELRHAVVGGQFALAYQPIVELASSTVTGYEALLRWKRPDGLPIGPDKFIPALEECGLIEQVGEWVLRQACIQAANWQRLTGQTRTMSVNVSPRQLAATGFVEQVAAALQIAAGLPATCLTLEITEGVLVSDADQVIARLHALKDLGVRLAVDDFGTGYSSLRYLHILPVDSVKIDRSFIAKIQDGPREVALAEAIVQVGHALDLTVVAEGIETIEHVTLLRSLGCQYGQGYYYARPREPRLITEELRTEADLAAVGLTGAALTEPGLIGPVPAPPPVGTAPATGPVLDVASPVAT